MHKQTFTLTHLYQKDKPQEGEKFDLPGFGLDNTRKSIKHPQSFATRLAVGILKFIHTQQTSETNESLLADTRSEKKLSNKFNIRIKRNQSMNKSFHVNIFHLIRKRIGIVFFLC